MKFTTISDVHIKAPGDRSECLMMKFLLSDEVQNSDSIYLLGDIFDLMIGPHIDYIKKYSLVFNKLKELSVKGKEIHYFEGNHDFHFRKLIENNENWFYHDGPFLLESSYKKILFAHGDELELNNKSYQKYRSFIRSRFIKLAAEDLVPYRIVDRVGVYFSKKSRERNIKNYGNHSENSSIKNKFRENISRAFSDYEFPDIIICGHSHCFEQWRGEGFEYYNNGFLPSTQKFFFFDGKNIESKDLLTD